MRVLWVEDEPSDGLLAQLTGWLDETYVDHDFPTVKVCFGWDYAGWRTHYREKPSPNAREIDFCADLDVLKVVLANRVVVERYDVILIDIDLTAFTRQGDWNECLDHARGGFWVYQQLLHRGFPSERLAFLTGNGDKAEAFRKQARELMLDAPRSFNKNLPDVSVWLSELEIDGYLRFRRGVIEGSNFLQGRIESVNRDFSHYLKKDANPEVDWRGYLESLRTALPPSLEGYPPKQVYRQFLRALGWPWEERVSPVNLSKIKSQDARDQEKRELFPTQQRKAIGWTMKCLRNWSSHGPELDEACTADLAWFVLLNFRALSLADDGIRPYEELLCGDSRKPVEPRDMGQLLAESHLRVAEKSPSDSFNFNELLNELANQHDRELNFPRELRKVFWHLLAGQNRESYDRDEARVTKRLKLFLSLNRYPKWVQTLADATFADTFDSELSTIRSTGRR